MGIAVNKRKNHARSGIGLGNSSGLNNAVISQLRAALITLENESLRYGLVDAAILIEQAVNSIERDLRIESWAEQMTGLGGPTRTSRTNQSASPGRQ